MAKDLQILSAANPPESAAVFHQTGDKNTQIAYANNVNTIINVIVTVQRPTGDVINTRFALCTEYYNLFVIAGETFADGHFTVPKDRALTSSEGIVAEITAQFAALTPEAISAIKTFPSLFTSENHQYGYTDADHLAFLGVVTDIRIQENGIKIYFQKFCSIPQQRINEIMFNLAIKGKPSYNELNRTHWAIKRVNLIEELRSAGISLIVPT